MLAKNEAFLKYGSHHLISSQNEISKSISGVEKHQKKSNATCELLPIVQASDAGLASQVALRAAEAAILDSLEALGPVKMAGFRVFTQKSWRFTMIYLVGKLA